MAQTTILPLSWKGRRGVDELLGVSKESSYENSSLEKVACGKSENAREIILSPKTVRC